ncbi:MAG: N-acetylmuramic acid 6-phosphate etherase [Clostridia bacterium]|nr:N-acetylmuramic acid 6-phosphate etherase [Clostridia bacterium]MDD6041481.1 N-acetylmuramic acid 6-phosphate etherase [Clostridia bacterium]
MAVELRKLDTEQRNQRTMQIDTLPTLEMLTLINQEDHRVAEAVKEVLPEIARAVDVIYRQLERGGRLFYVGAGTSGRLGLLDAVECPPTFGVSPELVQGLIAGGENAFVKAVEGAEDHAEMGRADLEKAGFCEKDALVGIAASGRTPYVLGAMDYARSLGAPVMALTCCRDSELSRHADITMAPVPGPEVITGSSRLKSGTAQKLVLNMLSTATMIKLGKVYGNLMVDVKATNEKLVNRAISIVCTATGVDSAQARATLEKCDFRCKTAIVMILLGLDAQAANAALDAARGHISDALRQQSAKGDTPE